MSKSLSYGDLVRKCKSLESRMGGALEEYARAKFERGCLLHSTVLGEKQYGAGLVESLAEELGCSDATLYKEHALAQFYGYDDARFESDITELKKKGRTVSYTYLLKQVKPEENPEAVGGEENHKDIVCKDIEELADKVTRATVLYPKDEQVQGAVQLGIETLVDMQDHADFLLGDILHPKPIKGLKIDLPHYLAWIRTLPCAVSGAIENVEAHHVVLRARGQNSLDLFCIPLAKKIHDEFHKLSLEAFEGKYGVSCRVLVLGYVQQYIKERE
jgi:hypothetical protein